MDEDARTRAINIQPTTPDRLLANFAGQLGATQVPGISGTKLTYLPGDIVDNAYLLTRLLGSGGMGAVFACRHVTLNKDYALKLLSAEELTEEAWARFVLEAKALARLNHPGIVGIHNMGIDKSQCPYYVMDLIDGYGLDTLIAKNRCLPVEQALDIFIQVAEAIGSAHQHDVIHRDIKPSNMMIEENPKLGTTSVKIVDFGIARLTKQGAVAQSQTATGMIFGTPYYMSPEQCEGKRVDARSDIYSLGCALFETLTGRPPFVGDNSFQTFMLHQTENPPRLNSILPAVHFSPALEIAIQKMLNKHADERYQNMDQLKHDLERIRDGKSIMTRGSRNLADEAANDAADKKVEKKYDKQDKDRSSNETKAWSRPAVIGLSLAALAIFGGGGGALLFYLQKTKPSITNAGEIKKSSSTAGASRTFAEASFSNSIKQAKVDTIEGDHGLASFDPDKMHPFVCELPQGVTEAENNKYNAVQFIGRTEGERFSALKNWNIYAGNQRWLSTKFKKDGVFHFPTNLYLGQISIGGGPLRTATGNIPAPANKSVFLYLTTACQEHPEILRKFGPDDLTGIAIALHPARQALDQIEKWTRLNELIFFNPIFKSLPAKTEFYDESFITDQDLPRLDKLKNLRSLGLCGPVTGVAIKKMTLLKTLTALELKRIDEIEPLLAVLPQYSNLKEIFLMHQKTTDQDLATLAAMKNLETLTIRRSYLTFDSLKEFKKMRSLKHLTLDRNDWTAVQKEELRKALPHCLVTFEPVFDDQYWPAGPQNTAISGNIPAD